MISNICLSCGVITISIALETPSTIPDNGGKDGDLVVLSALPIGDVDRRFQCR